MTVEYAGRPGTLRREGMDDPPWRSGDDEWTVAGEPESSAWWYPANDHPSDPAQLDVSVRVPKEYQAISVGRLASKDTAQEADFDTWHWVMSESLPTYASFLAIGHYELREGEADGRPYVYAASTRFSDDERAKLFAAMERTPALVSEIEAFAGPYPYSEIGGFVPATALWFAGLETATRPVYVADALMNDGYSDELLVHELAHMWFGDHVTLLQWNDIFTNEAFASWAYWEVVERRGGTKADARLDSTYERTKDDAEFWRVTMIDPGPAEDVRHRLHPRTDGPPGTEQRDGRPRVRRSGPQLGRGRRRPQPGGLHGLGAGPDQRGPDSGLPAVAVRPGRSGEDRRRTASTAEAQRRSSRGSVGGSAEVATCSPTTR